MGWNRRPQVILMLSGYRPVGGDLVESAKAEALDKCGERRQALDARPAGCDANSRSRFRLTRPTTLQA